MSAADSQLPVVIVGAGLAGLTVALHLADQVPVIVLAKPCSKAVSNFVVGFGNPDAAMRLPDAAAPTAPEGVILRGDMTPEQIKAAVEAEQARVRGATTDAAVAAPGPTPPPP